MKAADGNPSRFRVVGGTETEQQPEAAPVVVNKAKKPRTKRPPMKDQLTPWHCAECTENLHVRFDARGVETESRSSH